MPLKLYPNLLVQYLKPQWKKVVLLSLLLLGFIATQLINPQVVRQFIDATQSHNPLETLWTAAALYIGIAFLEQVLGVLVTYVSETVAWTATNQLREDRTLHCLKLDLSFHKTHTPGEMIERIDGDINDLADFFSQFVPLFIGNLLLLVGVVLLLWQEDWRVGLVTALISLVALAVVIHIRNVSLPYWQRVRQASADLFGFLGENLGAREEIRASGATSYVLRQLSQLVRRMLQHEHVATRFQLLSSGLSFSLFGLAYIAAFILGDQAFHSRSMTIGTIFLIFYYLGFLHGRIFFIVNQIESLQKTGASVARIVELGRRKSTVQDGALDTLFAGPLEVEFDQISFRYGATEEAVLSNVSARLPPGRVLGLLGRTGSGKTTMAHLLFRFYDPEGGTIRLGDGQGDWVDLRQVRLSVLRQHIGMVTQAVHLFHATIRDNLTFFDQTISDQQILEVFDTLGLRPWLEALPCGLDTILAGGESSLSAGEGQLLAFARVFLQNPGLVILDEASSRLDPVTEQLVDRAVKGLVQGRTAIIIAHRLKTVQWVDDILILDRGHIQEYGARSQLESDCGSRYFQLQQAADDVID